MADIQTYLDEISSAVYGEEVRSSIINALDAVNTSATDSAAAASTSATNASSSATTAKSYASNASTSASAAASSASDASDSADEAASSAEAAAESAEEAASSVERTDDTAISTLAATDYLRILRGTTRYKALIADVGNYILNTLTNTSLATENKNVYGALNELMGYGVSDIAAGYDSTATYSVGDVCVHDGTVYVCTTAVETAGDFDSSYWTATTLGDQVSSLNSNVDNLVGTVLYENLTGTYPGFSSGSVTLSDSMQNYKKLRFDAYSSTWGIRPFTVEVDISVLENFEVLTLTETVFSTTPNVYACSMILSFTDTTFTVTSNKRCLIGDASVSDIAQLYVYRITGLK